MNHITQRNQLEIQLKNYKDFMPLCPPDSVPKLVKEMMKIHCRIEKIKEFSLEKLVEKVDYQYETKQSKINFKTV
jgi:predicted component of type VI protein secretion system